MALQFLNEHADVRVFHVGAAQQPLQNRFELSGRESGGMYRTQQGKRNLTTRRDTHGAVHFRRFEDGDIQQIVRADAGFAGLRFYCRSGKLFVRMLQALIDVRRSLHLGRGLAASVGQTLRECWSRNPEKHQTQNCLRHKNRSMKSAHSHVDLPKSGQICATGSAAWLLTPRAWDRCMSFSETLTPAAIKGASTV